jgi:uncharacterized protein
MRKPASRAQLEQAIQEAEKRAAFQAIRSRLHGRRHWICVAEIALELHRRLPIPFASIEVPILFAVLHDSQRSSDGRDPEHGARAAFVAQSMREDRFLNFLKEDDYWRLIEALVDHSDGYTTKDLAVGACWDADRLALVRLGMQIDPALLSLYRFGGLSHIAVRSMLLYAQRLSKEQEQKRSWENALNEWEARKADTQQEALPK